MNLRNRAVSGFHGRGPHGLQSEIKLCSDTEERQECGFLVASATSDAGLIGSSDRCCALRTGGHGEEQSIMKFTFQNQKVHLLDSQKPVTAALLTRRALPARWVGSNVYIDWALILWRCNLPCITPDSELERWIWKNLDRHPCGLIEGVQKPWKPRLHFHNTGQSQSVRWVWSKAYSLTCF